MIAPEFIEHLLARVSIIDVIGRRVDLKKRGREHVGLCPFHNECTPSFTVNEGKRFFHCFGCGSHGDVIAFVMRTEGMMFPDAAMRLAADVGLADGEGLKPLDHAELERQQERRQRERERNDIEAPAGLSDSARRIVAEAKPVTADDLAGRYLIERCCAIPQNDVLFHRSIWHPQERRAYPAMVAVISDVCTVKPISLHFTFLDPDGGGKAKIERPRLYLAGHRKAGGVVRLTPDDAVTMGITIGEGLETSLSYMLEYSSTWAALDAGNLGAFPVLPGIEGITVLVDNDDAGRRAFAAVRDRYRAVGFTNDLDVIGIEITGKPGADVNDLASAA